MNENIINEYVKFIFGKSTKEKIKKRLPECNCENIDKLKKKKLPFFDKTVGYAIKSIFNKKGMNEEQIELLIDFIVDDIESLIKKAKEFETHPIFVDTIYSDRLKEIIDEKDFETLLKVCLYLAELKKDNL